MGGPRFAGFPAALAAALLVPAAVLGATTLGSPFDEDAVGGFVCGDEPGCVYIQTRLDGSKTRAPFDGVIKSFRAQLEDPGRLQVYDKRKGGRFKLLRQSKRFEGSAPEIERYETNLRIKRGDYIGIRMSFGGQLYYAPGQGCYKRFVVVGVGEAAKPDPDLSGCEAEAELRFNARVTKPGPHAGHGH